MANKYIYLETAFWDKYSECYRDLLQSDEELLVIHAEKQSQWFQLYKFMSQSDIVVDKPIAELNERSKHDPFLRKLLKKNGDGLIQIEFQDEPFPDLESENEFQYVDDCFSLYFTAKNHNNAARRHGVINICLDNIWNQGNKFKDTGKNVKEDKAWSWKKMDILKENSNVMVIVDNYIISPNYQTGRCSLRKDIKEILEIMLPDYCVEGYVLSVFYFDKSESLELQEKYKKQYHRLLIDFISRSKPNLEITIELFPTVEHPGRHHKEYHDRTIVTNNVWIGSEAGFDLLIQDDTLTTKARAIKTTKTHGLYLGFGNEIADWLEESYETFVTQAQNCLKKYKYESNNSIINIDE